MQYKGYPELFILLFMALIFISCNKDQKSNDENQPVPEESKYYNSADLSFLPELRENNITFLDQDGQTVNVISFLKSKGLNMVRLRLWHTPETGHSNLQEVKNLAQEIKGEGMEVLLDLHYSDTWADPANQTIPAAWQGLNIAVLKDSVYNYTKRVIQTLKDQNTMPAIVQIGNETNSGFLWNLGKVGGSFDNNWPNFGVLVKAAISAIREVDTEDKVKVMLHISGTDIAEWFFTNVKTQNIDYQVIGLSYYSVWHGTGLDMLRSRLDNLSQAFDKEIMLVETAYPWTLEWNDWTNNIYGLEDQLISGYPATPEGQKEYLKKLNAILKAIPDDKGIGYCWWEPDWVAYKGTTAEDGSVWENCTWFNFDYQALPIVDNLEPPIEQ
ncbi:MAG: glycosyl hydrolase 53 family protein [Bacteroidales bacterium]|nr:glycosyl hydrolase 53 family protein [Bacteroidales bacterium]